VGSAAQKEHLTRIGASKSGGGQEAGRLQRAESILVHLFMPCLRAAAQSRPRLALTRGFALTGNATVAGNIPESGDIGRIWGLRAFGLTDCLR